MAAPEVRGSTGLVQLGRSLGRGAEGEVFEATGRPDVAAKIYLAPVSSERSDKLLAMVTLSTKALSHLTAWPVEILKRPDGRVCGFLMANLRDSKDIHRLYSPKSRLSDFPHADWRMVVRAALNTARAFAVLHQSGHLVGDVNHGGVRVSSDATVRLIDCDSFQISHDGRVFVCEVGVQDFTPPELHGLAFKQVIRTTNHDNFGLAVLMFQLLLNGRHPFAGRYSGPGDMPIEKAIPEFRYAYSVNGAAMQMKPPPYSAPPAAASPLVAALWERAFGKAGVAATGRPSAQQWVQALTELEKQFTRCTTQASHYYFKGQPACPWCPIEKAGVALFGVPMGSVASQGRNGLSLEIVWREIEAIRLPQLPAVPPLPLATPTAQALDLGKRHGVWRTMGWALGLVVLALGSAVDSSLVLVWLVLAWVIGAWVNSRGKSDHAPLRASATNAQAAYASLVKRWGSEHGVKAFDDKRAELTKIYDEWAKLPSVRQQRYAALVANRQEHALKAYLDSFEIERATIAGIGRAKTTMLESFGIETAADVTFDAVMEVPGFGPTLTTKLVQWRQGIERRFRFDPRSTIDPRQVADLDRTINARRAELERDLNAGKTSLQQSRAAVLSHRAAVFAPLQEAAVELAQATANLEALRGK